jgi:hypothetical protein
MKRKSNEEGVVRVGLQLGLKALLRQRQVEEGILSGSNAQKFIEAEDELVNGEGCLRGLAVRVVRRVTEVVVEAGGGEVERDDDSNALVVRFGKRKIR